METLFYSKEELNKFDYEKVEDLTKIIDLLKQEIMYIDERIEELEDMKDEVIFKSEEV